jgi:hypothetical protein
MLHQHISVKPSLQSNEAAPAGDERSKLLQRDGETRPVCAQCRAEIVDGHWFCRLPGNETPTLLCSPRCAMRYFDRSHPERKGAEQSWETGEERFHFIMNGARP